MGGTAGDTADASAASDVYRRQTSGATAARVADDADDPDGCCVAADDADAPDGATNLAKGLSPAVVRCLRFAGGC